MRSRRRQRASSSSSKQGSSEKGRGRRWRQQQRQVGGESGSGESLPAAQGFPGMRLVLFLAGPPNCGGSGSVVARCPRPADMAAAAQAAQQATEQAAKELASLVLDPVYPELSAWTDAVARSNHQQQQRAAEAAAATALASAGDLSHAAPPGVSPQELTVNLAAAEFYAEAGAAAAALGLSIDIFAACPQWMGEYLSPHNVAISLPNVLWYCFLASLPVCEPIPGPSTPPLPSILQLHSLPLPGYGVAPT